MFLNVFQQLQQFQIILKKGGGKQRALLLKMLIAGGGTLRKTRVCRNLQGIAAVFYIKIAV